MISHIDLKVDYAFKKIFGSEANAPVLIDLLNAVLRRLADERIVSVELGNPFNDKGTAKDKVSVVDVKARDQLGRLYNIEMQMCATPEYPERVLYYWAKIYGSQLGESDDYDKLKATISISFLNDVVFPEVADFHLDFRLRSSQHPSLVLSDLQWMHLVELPKFRKVAEELADAFDGWCYFLKNAADLDSAELPAGLQTPAVRKAMEVLNVISNTDVERERYEAAVRWERDHRSYVRMAEKAVAEAEKAEKKGIVGRIHLCQRLLKAPETPKEDLLALSVEALEAQADTLEGQLVPKS
jgi:predicted transposase/invertase (TIGR01784 family)